MSDADLRIPRINSWECQSNIRDTVKASPPVLLNDEGNMASFLEDIEYLIKAETHHAELVTKYVGKVERIH